MNKYDDEDDDVEIDEEYDSDLDVCNMSRFKMQQEERRFQQTIRVCQAWIEVCKQAFSVTSIFLNSNLKDLTQGFVEISHF